VPNVIGTIITDCADDDARGRQELRFNSLFGVAPTFVGVGSYSPLEAGGHLADQLDVLANFPLHDKERQNIVLVNVAPRGDVRKKWDNGTPFVHFTIGKTIVVSTYEENYLAFMRDLGITSEVQVMDIPTVTAAAIEWGDLTQAEANKINNTQFRSLEFMPLAAYWVWQGKPVPAESLSLADLPSIDGQAWLVDNFGNVKTTLTAKDVAFEPEKQITLANGKPATCYTRLADVPKGATALTIGSSGYGEHRFLEVAIGHRGRAADEHGFGVGSKILQ
jgi:hypothetical protein